MKKNLTRNIIFLLPSVLLQPLQPSPQIIIVPRSLEFCVRKNHVRHETISALLVAGSGFRYYRYPTTTVAPETPLCFVCIRWTTCWLYWCVVLPAASSGDDDMPPPFYRVLSVQSPMLRGNDVYIMQNLLLRSPFVKSLQTDSIYGQSSAAAVAAFQVLLRAQWTRKRGLFWVALDTDEFCLLKVSSASVYPYLRLLNLSLLLAV